MITPINLNLTLNSSGGACGEYFTNMFSSSFQPLTLVLLNQTLHIICPYSELFWSAFSPYFPAFGLNTGKIRTRTTPNTSTFYAVKANSHYYAKSNFALCNKKYFAIANLRKLRSGSRIHATSRT